MNLFPQLVAIGAVMFATALPLAAGPPPKDWNAWAAWVEKRAPVTDAQGHGPDIGGDEWMAALDRRLGISDGQGHGPDHGSDEWRGAVEHKLAQRAAAAEPPADARELLSAHETEATFDGLKQHRCMGLTSLCPDDCGHSGALAVFTITRYLRHHKPGEFGDPKQETFQILIEDNRGNTKVAPAIRTTVQTLKPGDAVRLDWNHDYVTRQGSMSPERVIVKLEPLAPAP